MPRHLLLLCTILLAAPAAQAQAADSVRHLPAATLRDAVAAAPGQEGRALYARMMVDAGAYTVIAIRRTADGEAEVHAEWDDVMLIQEGAATLLTGSAVRDARQTAPGELRGGEIVDGIRRPVSAGDVVTVPAGVPHQILVGPGQSVSYLVVKVRRAGAPHP
jgi:mannose-6-phosphate isomerase-like protein (cupin superfamily)